MLIEGRFTLKAPIQEVWDFILLPGTLTDCVPGAEEIKAVDDRTYEGTIKQKVGPISVKMGFSESLTEVDPPKHLKVIGKGADVSKAGTFTQETIVDLNELAEGEVEISYSSNISLVGRLATFGERIMRAKIKSVGEQFIGNLQEKLESHLG